MKKILNTSLCILALFCWTWNDPFPGLRANSSVILSGISGSGNTLFSDTTTYTIKFKPYYLSLDSINTFRGIQFYEEGIIYLMQTKNKYKSFSTYIPFGRYDTYYAPVKNHQIIEPEYFCNNFPFPFTPGALSFTNNNRTLYFTKQDIQGKAKNKLQIYKTIKVNNTSNSKPGWSKDFIRLSFCSDDYSTMHPAVSLDGLMLVFSSDRSSTHSGNNLFLVTQKSSGWSEPVALDNNINTDGHEIYPFLDTYNNLYFSSDRKGGFGGYDIFVAKYNGTGWEDPVNLGSQVNSVNDELMFKLSREDTLAVLISIQDSLAEALFFQVYLPDDLKIAHTKVPKIEKPPVIKETVQQKEPSKPERKSEQVKPPPPQPQIKKTPEPAIKTIPAEENVTPEITFRVQIISSPKKQTNLSTITINGKKYKTFVYYYKGAYRYTVGEYKKASSAIPLSKLCRKAGYPQAFVIALQGDKRILDPSVFKR